MYQEDRAYRQDRAYRDGGVHEDDPGYGEADPYLGDGLYRDDSAYPRSGQYRADTVHVPNGRYPTDAGYRQDGRYRQDAASGTGGRYRERGPYPDDGGYRERGPYPDDGGYRERGPYPDDRGYRDRGPYPDDRGYREGGPYPDDGGYREGSSLPGDGGYPEEGPYPPDGAYGEDRKFRQAQPAVSPRTATRRRGRRGRGGPRRRGTRLVLRTLAAIVATFVLVTGWSLVHALTTPGGGTAAERVAEWARNHYMGPLVTFGEWLTYKPPVKGGKPNVSFDKLGGRVVHKKKRYHGLTPIIPANIGSPAGQSLPGEGVWKLAVSVKGLPAVFKTYVRESKTYSSYYAGIVSMDQRLLRFSLRPGTEDPGYGHWGVPMNIPPGHRLGLVATFNSGFRLYAAGGGFYLNGHYDRRLVRGAASEVYFRNGTMTIGTWGHGSLHMGPSISAVRQNLRLIVANGQVPASVDHNVETNWGATLGGGYYVWRSGVGITKDGRIIYVYGPALNVRDLADLLKRAGCVSAMELDINPDWMSFMYYLAKNHPANPTPVNLLRNQVQPADRYYSVSNRDFTAVFAR